MNNIEELLKTYKSKLEKNKDVWGVIKENYRYTKFITPKTLYGYHTRYAVLSNYEACKMYLSIYNEKCITYDEDNEPVKLISYRFVEGTDGIFIQGEDKDNCE